jgi:hypothetical protein
MPGLITGGEANIAVFVKHKNCARKNMSRRFVGGQVHLFCADLNLAVS